MDKHQLLQVASQYGTPCYVFDEDVLATRMEACKRIIGSSVSLCYSIKANPFLVPAMAKLVPTLEVCSPGELEICHALGISPDAVLFSGVHKDAESIARALDLGVRTFTCESPLHVRLLNEAALSRNLVLPVLLRLTAGSQFGMDESDLRDAIRNRSATPGLDIVGIHYFSGTQQKRLTGQRKELQRLADLIDSLQNEEGFTVQRIEYGAGLYFPYFEGEEDTDTLQPLRELAPDLQALAERCALTVEMGRFFASPCGVYLTTVADTKINRGTPIAILDGGMHHLNYYGGSMGMRMPHLLRLNESFSGEDDDAHWMLCGSLCTTADVIVRAAPLSNLRQGEILAFLNAGAYSVTEAPALFLSRTMPRVVLYSAGKPRLVRDWTDAWLLNCPHENL